MSDRRLLEELVPLLHGGCYLGRVESADDPDDLGRVRLRLLAFDGTPEQDAVVWARVAAPFAGERRGAFLLPDEGDEVLVTLVNGDPRQPVVIGGLWNGAAPPPERLEGNGVDRWSLTGKAGTRIAIEEKRDGQPTIRFTTPGGVSGELSDEGGGRVVLEVGATRVSCDRQAVTVETGGQVTVQASQVKVSAGMLSVDAAVSRFSGVVQADTVITNSVVSASYTPGAGNIW